MGQSGLVLIPPPSNPPLGQRFAYRDKNHKTGGCFTDFVSILSRKMSIITLSDALIQKQTLGQTRIIRDRLLCGFCIKIGRRNRTFLVATSCRGKQIRMTLGRWPLLSVDEARQMAMAVLKSCRAGELPAPASAPCTLTLRELLPEYAKAKGIKASSLKRYRSLANTHFQEWLDQPIENFRSPVFAEHCHNFAQTKGAALVETGRGMIGAIIKYANAVHRIEVPNPFERLASAGLMPDRAQPRVRKLQMNQLKEWYQAVERLPELQRDYLKLLAFTGLRRNEGVDIRVEHVDFEQECLTIPETKNGKVHTLPVTPIMKEILAKRCQAAQANSLIFAGLSASHVAKMAIRLGAPDFMLHDLRKLFATTGEKLKVGDAVLRRILNHTAKRSDVLHRNYVSLSMEDIRRPFESIQIELLTMMQSASNEKPSKQNTQSDYYV